MMASATRRALDGTRARHGRHRDHDGFQGVGWVIIYAARGSCALIVIVTVIKQSVRAKINIASQFSGQRLNANVSYRISIASELCIDFTALSISCSADVFCSHFSKDNHER